MILTSKSEWFVLDKPIGEPELAKNWKEHSYNVQRSINSKGDVVWYGCETNWKKADGKWFCLDSHNSWVECEMPIYEKLYLEQLKQEGKNIISDEGLVELYTVAYNDGFDNIGDLTDIIDHREQEINIIKKKYCE